MSFIQSFLSYHKRKCCENNICQNVFTRPSGPTLYKAGNAKRVSGKRSLSIMPLTIGGNAVKRTCCPRRNKLSIWVAPLYPLYKLNQNKTNVDIWKKKRKNV